MQWGVGAQGGAQGVRRARPARQGEPAAVGELAEVQGLTTIRSTGEGVSINLAGREPDGIVGPGDFERMRNQVMDASGTSSSAEIPRRLAIPVRVSLAFEYRGISRVRASY
jgi:hypothetical protein